MDSPTAAVTLPSERVSARPSARLVALRLGGVVALVALDLWSKARVFAWLEVVPPGMRYDSHGRPRWELVGDWLAFMLSENPGMAWGLDFIPPLVLTAGRALAVVLLAVLLVRTERGRWVFTLALALILAGATGNLWDNLSRGNLFSRPANAELEFGMVRDFIDVYFRAWDWHFPTFNVADSCISVGAALLLLSSVLPSSSRQGEAAAKGR